MCISTVDNCGAPGVPANGQTFGNSTTVGSIVTHTCNEGFVLDGANRRECLSNGSWSEPLPSCKRKYIAKVNIRMQVYKE